MMVDWAISSPTSVLPPPVLSLITMSRSLRRLYHCFRASDWLLQRSSNPGDFGRRRKISPGSTGADFAWRLLSLSKSTMSISNQTNARTHPRPRSHQCHSALHSSCLRSLADLGDPRMYTKHLWRLLYLTSLRIVAAGKGQKNIAWNEPLRPSAQSFQPLRPDVSAYRLLAYIQMGCRLRYGVFIRDVHSSILGGWIPCCSILQHRS